MELVLCNTQSELHPLEEGKHAAESRMDLKAYAEASGKVRKTLSDKVMAWRVWSVADIRHDGLRDSWSQLSVIHAAPDWLWPALVNHRGTLPVKRTDRPTPAHTGEPRRMRRTTCPSQTDPRPARANRAYSVYDVVNEARTPAHTGEPSVFNTDFAESTPHPARVGEPLPFNPLICGTLPNRRPRRRDRPTPRADLRCAGDFAGSRQALDPCLSKTNPRRCCCRAFKFILQCVHIGTILWLPYRHYNPPGQR